MRSRCFRTSGDREAFATPLLAPGQREVIHVDAEVVPLAFLAGPRKYLPCKEVASMDAQALPHQAVKSPYGLAVLEKAGQAHGGSWKREVPLRYCARGSAEAAEFGCDLSRSWSGKDAGNRAFRHVQRGRRGGSDRFWRDSMCIPRASTGPADAWDRAGIAGPGQP